MSDAHDSSQLHDAPEFGLHADPDAALCHPPASVCSVLESYIHICANNGRIQECYTFLLAELERYTRSIYTATALWSPTHVADPVCQHNEGPCTLGFKNSWHQSQVDTLFRI
jgi:hypothetical protein